MKKAEKIGILAVLCGIILLFLIASTDLVLEENKKEVYTVAFVTDGSAEERFQSLRKGMEKAAKKWNVDLVVDAPEISGNAAEQELIIEELVGNGAQAVITVPADQAKMEKFLDQSQLQIPVITLEKEIRSEKKFGCYTYDGESAAKKLAREVLASEKEGETIALYATDADT
ncbi:periplasmic binding protein/LacI transcriptional regulator, partial [gut metagenome]